MDTPIETNKIYNEDCLLTLSKMKDESVDLIVTSPPYNKNHWIKNKSKSKDSFIRKIEYSSYDDNIKYYKTYDKSKYLKTNIQFILHWADWMSTTIERDQEIKAPF